MTPIANPRVTSPFGPRTSPITGLAENHKGQDMVDTEGDRKLRAIWDTVKTDYVQGYNSGRGNTAYLYYSDTLRVLYQHMASFASVVRAKKHLKQGDSVGVMGTSGDSTGIHLHIEVQIFADGKWTAVEPSKYTEVPNSKGVHPGNNNLDSTAGEAGAEAPAIGLPWEGIDVSKYQGNIDWDAAKASGKVGFALLRAVSSSTAKGGLYVDDYFERNYSECKRLGIPVGCYLYSYATSEAVAKVEAHYLLRAIRGKQFEYPVYFDQEYEPPILALSNAQRTDIVLAFCSEIAAAGYVPGLYASTNFINTLLDYQRLSNLEIWAAQYGPKCSCKLPFAIWQHHGGEQRNTQTGKVTWPAGSCPGVAGACDLDSCDKDYPAIIRAAGLNGYPANDDRPSEEPNMKDIGMVWTMEIPEDSRLEILTELDVCSTVPDGNGGTERWPAGEYAVYATGSIKGINGAVYEGALLKREDGSLAWAAKMPGKYSTASKSLYDAEQAGLLGVADYNISAKTLDVVKQVIDSAASMLQDLADSIGQAAEDLK